MIRAIIVAAILASVPLIARAAAEKAPAKPKAAGDSFSSDNDRTVYAWGFKVGQNLAPIGFSASESKAFSKGISDALAAKGPAVSLDVYVPKISDLQQGRMAKVRAAEAEKAAAESGPNKAKGAEFADKFSKEKGVKPIAKGGWYQSITEGKGPQPKPEETVKVDYRGTLIDGTEFDSSYKRGQPASFPLNRVIPCWTNGVAMMKVGGKAKLVCPSDVGYGDVGNPPVIPPGSTLVFEVELHEIVKP